MSACMQTQHVYSNYSKPHYFPQAKLYTAVMKVLSYRKS